MKTVNLDHILTEFDRFNEIDKLSRLTVINAMREACNQAIDNAAEIQAKQYDEAGFTSTGKKINDLILSTKSQII